MSKLIACVFSVFLAVGCGVKKQEPVPSTPQVQIGERDLPVGVLYSANKKFLVRSSVQQIAVGDENKEYAYEIDYAISTTLLEPINDSYTVEVVYGMPSMPQMKIKPAVILFKETGRVSVTYRIDMAQDWQMVLKVRKNDGTLEDTLTYNYYIPE